MTSNKSVISVVIPARNEEASIGRVIAALPAGEVSNVIVCDNNSQDRTARIAAEAGAEVVFEAVAGYGAACLRALSKLPSNTDIVVFLDGDFSDDPAELLQLTTPISEGRADLVLGSRVQRALPGSLTAQQRFGNWLATSLIGLIYGRKFYDLGPFRAISATALNRLGMKDTGMGWTVEMQLKALRYNLKVEEIPVNYKPRIGKSKISGTLMGSTRAAAKIITLILLELIRRRGGTQNG